MSYRSGFPANGQAVTRRRKRHADRAQGTRPPCVRRRSGSRWTRGLSGGEAQKVTLRVRQGVEARWEQAQREAVVDRHGVTQTRMPVGLAVGDVVVVRAVFLIDGHDSVSTKTRGLSSPPAHPRAGCHSTAGNRTGCESDRTRPPAPAIATRNGRSDGVLTASTRAAARRWRRWRSGPCARAGGRSTAPAESFRLHPAVGVRRCHRCAGRGLSRCP